MGRVRPQEACAGHRGWQRTGRSASLHESVLRPSLLSNGAGQSIVSSSHFQMSQASLGVFGLNCCRDLLSSTLSEVPSIIPVKAQRPVSLDCKPFKLAREPAQKPCLWSASKLLKEGPAI